MYTQGGVTYTPSANAERRSFPKGTVCPLHVWGRVPSSQPLLETMIFGLIVHTYSCYQSENNSFICLLKRAIDPSVLNHFI